jgi:hypothetical protein
MPGFNPNDYVDVQTRINVFWKKNPLGRIATELMSLPDEFERVVFCARVYRSQDDSEPAATGWAAEVAGGGGANRSSWHENAETSAIGRALANLGYSKNAADRPSRQEMAKAADAPVERSQPVERVKQDRPAPPRQSERRDAPAPAQRVGAIKPDQLRRIFAVANEKLREVVGPANVEATIKPIAYNSFDVASMKELSYADAESFIDYLNRTDAERIVEDGEVAAAEVASQAMISDDEAREIAWRERLESPRLTLAELNAIGKEIAAAKLGDEHGAETLRARFRQRQRELQHQPTGVGALPGMPDEDDSGTRVGGFVHP